VQAALGPRKKKRTEVATVVFEIWMVSIAMVLYWSGPVIQQVKGEQHLL
jgi:hypothetical protein